MKRVASILKKAQKSCEECGERYDHTGFILETEPWIPFMLTQRVPALNIYKNTRLQGFWHSENECIKSAGRPFRESSWQNVVFHRAATRRPVLGRFPFELVRSAEPQWDKLTVCQLRSPLYRSVDLPGWMVYLACFWGVKTNVEQQLP